MEYTTLGATGLRVSVAGLGGGGNSRLGLGVGKSEHEAIELVRTALDLGVNFFDTAERYGTEDVLGRALQGVPRDRVVVSTKSLVIDDAGNLISADRVIANVQASLRRLRLEHIDVFHLHAVHPDQYEYAHTEIAPALLKQKALGRIAHIGITATPPRDPDQTMLALALDDSCWEVMMLAFHMMNQLPAETLLPRARAQGVGTLLMFAVRNIFSRAGALQKTLHELAAKGELPHELAGQSDPLGFLIHEQGAANLTEAAYRFARHESGADVVLFGTGDPAHLRTNVASILKPPLPCDDVKRLRELFGHLRGVGLDLPDKARFNASPAIK